MITDTQWRYYTLNGVGGKYIHSDNVCVCVCVSASDVVKMDAQPKTVSVGSGGLAVAVCIGQVTCALECKQHLLLQLNESCAVVLSWRIVLTRLHVSFL